MFKTSTVEILNVKTEYKNYRVFLQRFINWNTINIADLLVVRRSFLNKTSKLVTCICAYIFVFWFLFCLIFKEIIIKYLNSKHRRITGDFSLWHAKMPDSVHQAVQIRSACLPLQSILGTQVFGKSALLFFLFFT